MTFLQKAIMSEIKEHNAERDMLIRFNKGIKFLSMERYQKEGYSEYTICCDGNSMVKYLVRCAFAPEEKYGNNIVAYMVNIYSDGSMGIYFENTEYMEKGKLKARLKELRVA